MAEGYPAHDPDLLILQADPRVMHASRGRPKMSDLDIPGILRHTEVDHCRPAGG